MGGDEVRGLPDGQDLGRLLVGDADPVAVLELDHQLDQVERVGLEVLLEAGVLADAPGIDLELGGQVLTNALEDLLSGHRSATLAAGADRKAPARLERRAGALDHALVDRPPRQPHRVLDALGPEAAVRHHHRLAQPEQDRAAHALGVELVAQAAELAADQQAAERSRRARSGSRSRIAAVSDLRRCPRAP